MQSHSDGEVWGLDLSNDQDTIVTSADDNKIMTWSRSKRQCTGYGTVNTVAKSLKRRGASSLTSYPDS